MGGPEVLERVEVEDPQLILDVIDGSYLERNVRALATHGRLDIIGLQNGLDAQLDLMELVFRRKSVYGTTLRSRPEAQKAAEAHRLLDAGRHIGKILLANGQAQASSGGGRGLPHRGAR